MIIGYETVQSQREQEYGRHENGDRSRVWEEESMKVGEVLHEWGQ